MVRTLLVLLATLVLAIGSDAWAVDPTGSDLVRGDAAARAIVDRLTATDAGAKVEVLDKRRYTDATTGNTYTSLKVRVDGQDGTAVLNESSGAFAFDAQLATTEAARVLATLPPVYGKMEEQLRGAVRALQGGVLGGSGGEDTPLAVTFHAGSTAGLDTVQAALGGVPAERFDAYEIRTVSATLPLRDVLRVGALADVTLLVATRVKTARLDVSVPHINADVVKSFGPVTKGLFTDIGIVDTGIDRTHPNLPFVVAAEADFTGGSQTCQGGPTPNVICVCAGGACVAGTCNAGPDMGNLRAQLRGRRDLRHRRRRRFRRWPRHPRRRHRWQQQRHVEGVAPLATLINAKAIPGVNTAGALTFAQTQGADVINGSYGFAGSCPAGGPNAPPENCCSAPPAQANTLCIVDADCGPGGMCSAPVSNGNGPDAVEVDHEVFAHNITVAVAAEERAANGRCSNNHALPCANDGRAFPDLSGVPQHAERRVQRHHGGCDRGRADGALGRRELQHGGTHLDNRSKPDIVAPGDAPGADDIDSTAHDWEGANPDFRDLAGTSMAAPHVAGVAAMLFSFGTARGILTDTPYIKAAILNNANRLAGWTRPGIAQPLDTAQGTGEVDALKSFRAYADDLRIWQQQVTGTDAAHSHWYYIDVEGQPVPIVTTLVFERHDVNQLPPAPPLSDLDLRLYDPTGTQVDLSISSRDSVEHIVYNATENGRYCIEVDPFSISPGPGELYALAANVSSFVYSRLQFTGTVIHAYRISATRPIPGIRRCSRATVRATSTGPRSGSGPRGRRFRANSRRARSRCTRWSTRSRR